MSRLVGKSCPAFRMSWLAGWSFFNFSKMEGRTSKRDAQDKHSVRAEIIRNLTATFGVFKE
jgi:hypothetical protein